MLHSVAFIVIYVSLLLTSIDGVYFHLDYYSSCTFLVTDYKNAELAESIIQLNQYGQSWTITNSSFASLHIATYDFVMGLPSEPVYNFQEHCDINVLVNPNMGHFIDNKFNRELRTRRGFKSSSIFIAIWSAPTRLLRQNARNTPFLFTNLLAYLQWHNFYIPNLFV